MEARKEANLKEGRNEGTQGGKKERETTEGKPEGRKEGSKQERQKQQQWPVVHVVHTCRKLAFLLVVGFVATFSPASGSKPSVAV